MSPSERRPPEPSPAPPGPTLDPGSVGLIRASWARLEPHGDTLAGLFYARLFAMEPRVRDLFAAADPESQSTKFTAMLGELVGLLDDPAGFEEVLAHSGRRHAGYGVLPRHYRIVGEALLWALPQAAGEPALDRETLAAWAEAYTRMAFLMQHAAP